MVVLCRDWDWDWEVITLRGTWKKEEGSKLCRIYVFAVFSFFSSFFLGAIELHLDKGGRGLVKGAFTSSCLDG